MKLRNILVVSAVSLLSVLTISQAQANPNGKSKFGIKVDNCSFDYDEENFCSDKRMKEFADVLKTKKPNFAKDKILYIYKTNNSVINGNNLSYRVVAIDKKTKSVTPARHAFNPTSSMVNSKGEHLEFNYNLNSNQLCVKGDVEAYRDAYELDPEYYPQFCLLYGKDGFEKNW